MTRFRLLGTVGIGVVAAMALGGPAMFVWLTPGSPFPYASALVFGFVAVAVVVGVILGLDDGPTETPYW